MTNPCDHKFVDSGVCLKCGMTIDEIEKTLPRRTQDFMQSVRDATKGVEPGVVGGVQRDEDGRISGGVSVGVSKDNLTFGGRVRYYGKRAWDAFVGVTWKPR